jgi:hypothetical protein
MDGKNTLQITAIKVVISTFETRPGKPGQDASARLADVLRRDRISSLRLRYRHPNVLPACALDIMAGIAYLTHCRAQPVVLVGHLFGGAVVMTAGAWYEHVAGVVAFAPQTSGATLAGKLAPRPLLVVHGTADTRLPYACGVQMSHWAQEPKQLVLYEGAAHRLDACADALDQLFMQWMPATLRSAACMGGGCGPVHGVHLWNRWTGPRNVSFSTVLEEEGYVDRSGGVCTLYGCRV